MRSNLTLEEALENIRSLQKGKLGFIERKVFGRIHRDLMELQVRKALEVKAYRI